MDTTGKPKRRGRKLPKNLRPLFWEYRFSDLRWDADRELITGRVLASGDWSAIRWLRRRAGDSALREWLQRRRGGGLSPKQLRYWQLILRLPRKTVDAWLKDETRRVWDKRLHA